MNLTIGQLIDNLITQQQKCWHAIDQIHELDKEVADMSREELEQLGLASQEAHRTNAARSKLVTAIDEAIKKAVSTGDADVFVDKKNYE